MLQKPASAVNYEKELGLDQTGIRRFRNLDEVRDNLDTITWEECIYCNTHLGIIFAMENGRIVDAYDASESPVYDRQVS